MEGRRLPRRVRRGRGRPGGRRGPLGPRFDPYTRAPPTGLTCFDCGGRGHTASSIYCPYIQQHLGLIFDQNQGPANVFSGAVTIANLHVGSSSAAGSAVPVHGVGHSGGSHPAPQSGGSSGHPRGTLQGGGQGGSWSGGRWSGGYGYRGRGYRGGGRRARGPRGRGFRGRFLLAPPPPPPPPPTDPVPPPEGGPLENSLEPAPRPVVRLPASPRASTTVEPGTGDEDVTMGSTCPDNELDDDFPIDISIQEATLAYDEEEAGVN